MLHRLLAAVAILLATQLSSQALAQYTPSAGQNAPMVSVDRMEATPEGPRAVKVQVAAPKDVHGNAQGNGFDLAVDGAFEGQTVLILDQIGNTLVNTVAALKQKGFSAVVFHSAGGGPPPTVKQLREALAKSCQVWLLSAGAQQLSDAHLDAIQQFFDAGHGVYIWGDNDPYYVDANRLATRLLPKLGMSGDLPGNEVVGISLKHDGPGLRYGHLITTGIERLYEGVTVATLQGAQELTPILYGSAGNLITAVYDKNGKRLVIDGGFTRLAVSWDDAGTARYVKNAASWLVNAERFKDTVAKR